VRPVKALQCHQRQEHCGEAWKSKRLAVKPGQADEVRGPNVGEPVLLDGASLSESESESESVCLCDGKRATPNNTYISNVVGDTMITTWHLVSIKIGLDP
jgi:hypothetical protein